MMSVLQIIFSLNIPKNWDGFSNKGSSYVKFTLEICDFPPRNNQQSKNVKILKDLQNSNISFRKSWFMGDFSI